jgi:hypothetical protein
VLLLPFFHCITQPPSLPTHTQPSSRRCDRYQLRVLSAALFGSLTTMSGQALDRSADLLVLPAGGDVATGGASESTLAAPATPPSRTSSSGTGSGAAAVRPGRRGTMPLSRKLVAFDLSGTEWLKSTWRGWRNGMIAGVRIRLPYIFHAALYAIIFRDRGYGRHTHTHTHTMLMLWLLLRRYPVRSIDYGS